MAPLDPDSLPTIDQAKALHEQHAQALSDVIREKEAEQEGAQEQTRAARQQPATPVPSVAPARSASDPAPEPEKQGVEVSKFLAPQPAPQPEIAPQAPPAPQEDPQIAAIKQAVQEEHERKLKILAEAHEYNVRLKDLEITTNNDRAIALKDAEQARELQTVIRRQQEEQSGWKGWLEAAHARWNPGWGAALKEARRREVEETTARLAKERKDYAVLIEQSKQHELDNLRERQAQQTRDFEEKHEQDVETAIREHEEAKRIEAELEAQRIHEEIERERIDREGPLPPKLGKM